jgi:hypothetical protein
MIYRREGMRHQCWSLVIVSTERGRQVGDEVLHHGLPRSRESPVYRRGHGESVFACASTLVRRGEYRAQTGIWRLLGFVSVRTIKGRSSSSRPTVSPSTRKVVPTRRLLPWILLPRRSLGTTTRRLKTTVRVIRTPPAVSFLFSALPLGWCNYVELIDTIFTDVEGVD